MSVVDGATIERRIRISRPDEGEEDARVQERGIRAKISLSACSTIKYFQRPTSTYHRQERTEPFRASGHADIGVKSLSNRFQPLDPLFASNRDPSEGCGSGLYM